MELVRGLPLMDHADSHRLGVNERLDLLARVCDAVHHAHQMGVVHRDLKPANILVDATTTPAQPKVLDFGVARASDADLRTIAAPTGAGVLVGTIPYMSPEQVAGEPDAIDARSDVYGLGVVLFELLTGKLPLALKGRSIPEAARMIRDDEPSRLSSVNPAFRGDLETIVQKALEKDKSRRYASAADLAGDIRRFLTHQPISARPNSTFYQLRKFARRNRVLVGGITATFLMLTLGVCAATLLALREGEQRRRADRRTAEAEQQAYRSHLSAAQVMLQNNRAIEAKGRLAAAPPELRGWEWRHLNWLADRSGRTLNAGDPVGGGVLSRDGRRVAGLGPDRVTLWSLPEGREIRTLRHSIDKAGGLAINSDGSRVLVSGSEFVMLDADSGAALWRLEAPGTASACAFSPDGARVAVFTGIEPQFQILDVESGAKVCVIPLPVSNASAPVYSPVNEQVACSVNKLPKVFDARTGSLIWQGAPELAKLAAPEPAYFTENGDGVVLACWTLLDAASGADRGRVCSAGFAGCIGARAGRVATIERDHTVLRDAQTGELICTLAQQKPIAFTPDGRSLLTRTDAGEVKLWDAAATDAPTTVASVADASFSASFSGDARLLATGTWGFVRLWNTTSAAEIWSTFTARRSIMSVAFAPDDGVIAAGSLGGMVRFLDVASGARRVAGAQLPQREDVKGLAWDPRGGRVFAATPTPRIYSVQQSDGAWSVFAELSEGSSVAWIAATAADPPRLAAGVTHGGEAGTGEVRTWDLSTGDLLWSVRCEATLVSGMFTADGTELLVGDARGAARFFDAGRGAAGRVVQLRGGMACATFSAEGRLVAGHFDSTVSICDAHSGEEVLTLAVPGRNPAARPEGTRALRFTPDGALLAAGARTALAVFETASPEAGYAERDRSRRVRQVIDALYEQSMMPERVVEAVMGREELPTALRNDAAALARSRGVHLPAINSRVWEVVRYAGRTPDECRQALREIEAVSAAAPEEWSYVNTLGIAQYRNGQHTRALESLTRSEALMKEAGAGSTPANLAFIAMCQHHLGRTDLAIAELEQARTVLRTAAPRSGVPVEDQAFVREAEALIAGGR